MKPARAANQRYLPTSPFNTPPVIVPVKQFGLDDMVNHDRYGLGRVTSVEESAVIVDFGTSHVRIMAPYTKMAKL